MARRKVKTIVNVTPGTTLTSGADLFAGGIDIPGANLLRITITARTATVLSTTATHPDGNLGSVSDGEALVPGADTIFESVIAGNKFQARVSVTTIIDKFIVEAYLDY